MCEPRRTPVYRQPTERERAFLRVIMRGYDAGLAQVRRCLVTDWDGGFLEVQVDGGPAFARTPQPLPGPALVFDETGAPFTGFTSIFWVDERGLLTSIEVTAIGDESQAPDRTLAYTEAARGANGGRLEYHHTVPPRM